MSRIKNEENVMNKSFTMSEILISLTIIGVIAAIVIPSLIGKLNEKVWANQRKALYSRMSQAIAMMPKLAGYGEYEGTWSSTTWDNYSVNVSKDTAAMAFVTDGLSEVMAIKNICDHNNFDKCALPSKFTNFREQEKAFPKKLSELSPVFTGKVDYPNYTGFMNPQRNIDTNAVAFETQNGESVAVFYNPQCANKDVKFNLQNASGFINAYSVMPYMCATFLYDLNGKKGPNKAGKDIWFISAIYADERIVSTVDPKKLIIRMGDSNYSSTRQYCTSQNARLLNEEEAIVTGYQSVLGIQIHTWINMESKTNGYKKVFYFPGMIAELAENSNWPMTKCMKR